MKRFQGEITMLKKIVFGSALIGITFGSLINFQQPAEASFWRKLDPTHPKGWVRTTGRKIDPTVRFTRKFKICNNTKNTVHYTVTGRKTSLRPNYCRTWKTPGRGIITFDKSFFNGYQPWTYSLKNGEYEFNRVNWKKNGPGIDLRRK